MGAGAVGETEWTREWRTRSTGDKTVTADDLDRLYAFVKATGWNVVHAVNCRNSNPTIAADEAEYAASKGGNSIVAFEIGNELDLGPTGPSDRHHSKTISSSSVPMPPRAGSGFLALDSSGLRYPDLYANRYVGIGENESPAALIRAPSVPRLRAL